jgi:trehalose 6-phosphate synthase
MMVRAARFLLVLLVGLGVLTSVAHGVLTRTTRRWFERDVELRARLAVTSARRSLVRHWDSAHQGALVEALTDITRDERVMGTAACDVDGRQRATSEGFPAAFACPTVLARLRAEGLALDTPGGWTLNVDLPGGPVHLYGVALTEVSPDGFVVVVHDMSFLERREATTRAQLLLAFFVLALAAAGVTVIAARLAWRGWQADLRRALRGDGGREFQPLMRDVRELVARLTQERDADAPTGVWSPERLRGVLTQHLQGERVVIVANREPYIHQRTEDGGVRVVHPASGLVTALEPVMRACSGVWVAHGSGSADRETVDAHDRVKVPPGEESYLLRRVWLTEEEEAGYYYGFSNEGLWPLCHVAHIRPEFREADWEQYRKVNQRFADAVCDEVDSDDPIVLLQDYHFALAPAMIRARLPRATIITFWHIPWPNPERVAICPWRDQLIAGILGSSILGFHTQQHCNNFLDAVDTFVESRIDRENNAVVQGARRTLVRPYPISIEWPVRWLAELPSPEDCAAGVRRELGLRPDALLGVGVDRLDYTKGIEERLAAVDTLLERHPELRGRFTFAQLAAPSRTRIARYQELDDRVEALANKINERWSTGDYRPVVLLRAHHEPPAVFRYFRAADLCYVSSLHDGMNLVAKEFVAARTDERGVLILSEFTGAARELTEALVVNPYDLGEASEAMAAALVMPAAEQQERMRAMRSLVAHFNVYRWAGRMLVDAAQLRSRERLTARLTRRLSDPGRA